MILFKSFYTHFLSWPFWMVCMGLFVFLFLIQRKRGLAGLSEKLLCSSPRFHSWIIYFIGLVIALLTITPFWIDGRGSSTGTTDDTWFLLITHMASLMGKDSSLWNRVMAGGTDYNLLHVPAFSTIQLYARFFEPWQVYSLIMLINMMAMFIFSWKLLWEVLKTNVWFAFFGGLLCSLTQGFWAEGEWPDGHVAYGHGMTLFPVVIYFFNKYFGSRYIYWSAIVAGILYHLSIPLPLHTVPMALLTISLWLFFLHWPNVRRCSLVLLCFALPIFLLNLAYLFTVMNFLLGSARTGSFIKLVRFFPYGMKVWFLGSVLIVGVITLIYKLKLNRETLIVRMMWLAISFLLVPAVAYLLQEGKIMSGYRWPLLYLGNCFSYIIISVFLVDRISKEVVKRNQLFGLTGLTCCLACLVLLCSFWFLNNIGMGLAGSYANGNWNYLTRNGALKKLMEGEKEPFRILNYGQDANIMFLGHYEGVESAGGFGNLMNKNQVAFWNYLKRDGHLNPNSLDIVEKQDVDANIRLGLLKLMNVKYVLSKIPLTSPQQLHLVEYIPEEGNNKICNSDASSNIQYGFMWNTLLDDVVDYWPYIQCLWHHRNYSPPLYIYGLINPYSRIYMAKQIREKQLGQEFADVDSLDFIVKKNSIIAIDEPSVKNANSEKHFSAVGNIELVNYKQDRMDFTVQSDTPQFVVLSEPNSRFWELFVDGKKTKYFRTNIAQTGFFTNAGISHAIYVYCPPFRFTDEICKKR